ncbi:hypothetical protein SAMN05216480_101876 [Pustulibacterium marinum]|uniref:Outer membrane protein beta-barrel domain-containing protein n=1 Tax=Pustulibacterium marinum TaxID=1224947 RepID=A0A1I7FDA3_9FLAO|nr:hypothetical protein [Pustulibacterium marinum]SFU34159.1 hypothetical protein SAMN05216480_101876 [Pustulibacterium marinum]
MSKKTSPIFFVLLMILSVHVLRSQTTDLFRVEYTYLPNSGTDNSIQRFRSLAQVPIPIKDDYLVFSFDYRYLKLELNDVPFETNDLNSTQRIEGTVGYVYKYNEDWRFALRGGVRLASNFDSKMVSDDMLYLVSAYAINDRLEDETLKNPYRLILGLLYTTTPGRNYPLPFVNYHVEHENWSYSLGVPKSNIHYYLNDKNRIQAFGTLDNFFANIQGDKMVDGQLAQNISMTNVLLGIGYEYYFTDHLLYYGYIAHSVYNDYRLRNNDRDDIYVIDDKNSIYFRTGVRFKF